MKKWRGLLGACALLVGNVAFAQVQDMPGGPRVNQLNLHEGVTQIARDVVWLHWMMLTICIVIFVGVFGVMFYSMWAHRKSRGHKPATFHEHLGVEVAWTVVPFLIVIAMALPATKTVVAMKDTSSPDLTIKVTGYQWKWGYEYLDGEAAGLKYLSTLSTPRAQIENREPKGEFYLMEVDKPMVVPVGKKVRVVLTAGDVIHSWMVPELGVKQDAIPGFLRDTWFNADKVGTYRGQCAELCGKDHAFMPIVVDVLSQADFDKWAGEQKKLLAAEADDPNKEWTGPDLIARGEKVFAANCVACHQANGKGIPGSFPPLDGDKVVLGPKAGQINTVLKGKPGTAMAAFGGQLNDTEIAAVITYTRNAWSNEGKGEDPVVQPKDVAAAR
ncbi:cytochrome c oxidase subunit II [Bordetella genomosp. 1]|uniref:Cytochrome c oxidase subunit 2 n=1 Tax=Bordetella genomosp. 1 TaxID=1395607 RepID=A0A261SVQ5_9BORD|nr:cytochrome c oxidase subunit II [Bordetella genomosp. 1]MDQ8030718.1 cytochrome c oxidase subunit II [Bordetella sp.]OZI40383.1 cytochrome c oxidase subunit II [Bordetella genomosp. 1]OZI68586.1 cytochrome c oxidase subunit II [Bordetella genomosp. 1]